MEKIINFVKSYPVITIVGVVILFIAISAIGGSLWASAQIKWLEYKNSKLEAEKAELDKRNEELKTEIHNRVGRISVLEEEIKERDTLLEAATQQVLEDKKSLADATNTYNRVRDDFTPMSESELRQRLCGLYPAQCR